MAVVFGRFRCLAIAALLGSAVIESSVLRKLSAWLLITAFGLVNLPPLETCAARRGRQSCCSSGCCCRMGHCSMAGSDAARGDAGHRTALQQMGQCSMGGPSSNPRRSVSCRCSISPTPSLAAAPVHGYLYFDPSSHNMVSRLPATSWLLPTAVPSSSDGFPQRADHPPRLSS